MNIKASQFLNLIIVVISFFCLFSCKKDKVDLYFPTQEINDCDNFDLILVAGQSNTNSGLYLDLSKDTSDYRIMQLGRFGVDNFVVIQGKEPLQSFDNYQDRIGFSVAFAQEYIKNGLLSENRKILIIHCGQGGTGFHAQNWNRGDPLYNDAVIRTKSVLKSGPNNRLIAILWHQGENDYGIKDSDYQYALDKMITDMRRDIGTKITVPFIVGGMVPAWVAYFTLAIPKQKIIAETPYRLPYIGYADPMVPFELMPIVVQEGYIHFDAENQREFGKRYFNEYVLLLNRITENKEYLNKDK